MSTREIKFRFWTPDKRMLNDHEGWVANIGINQALECSASYGYRIMQYTGLKDKNGKEIYEGDFIRHPTYYDTPEMSSNPLAHDYIIYKDGAFRFNDGEGLLFEEMENYDGDFEIIGNIYENPELLTEKSA